MMGDCIVPAAGTCMVPAVDHVEFDLEDTVANMNLKTTSITFCNNTHVCLLTGRLSHIILMWGLLRKGPGEGGVEEGGGGGL